MITNLNEQTLALAGMVQSAKLVNDLAIEGSCDEEAFKCLINSIFIQNPSNVLAVYGQTRDLQVGLNHIIKLINEKIVRSDKNVSRYVISLIHLERKLAKSPERLQSMGKKIQQIEQQAAYFSLLHPTIISNLAEVYLENISTYRFRIHVMGNPTHISNAENLCKIRTLLLAGIRSCVLWRQIGGNRLHLFLARKKIVETANHILNIVTDIP